MSWINSRQFQISNRNGRHYVFRRNSDGNTEINIPRNITTKVQAQAWLRAHPERVTNPTRYRNRRRAAPAKPLIPVAHFLGLYPWIKRKEEWAPKVPPVPTSPSNWSPKYYGPNNSPPLYQAVSPPWRPPTPSPGSPNKASWQMPCDKLRASIKKLKAIGSGRQGKIYLASRSQGARKPFAIKIYPRDLRAAARREPQPSDVEFRINKKAWEVAPEGVIHPFDIVRCIDFAKPVELNMANVQNARHFDKSKQGLIFMEYAAGGSLRKWLSTTKQAGDEMAKHLISQVLRTLGKIQARYPYFRHNDMHLENIFVTERGFLIGDFGWARLEKNGTNPAVNTANGTSLPARWGVGPRTDARFDHHMFLSELRDILRLKSPEKYPQALAFLNKAIPAGYRGQNDLHVRDGRLKYDDPCPGLPSLGVLLRDPYIKGVKRVSSPQLAAAKARLRKVNPSPPKPKRLVTSANLAAAKKRLKKRLVVKSANLTAAKARLRKVVPKRPKRITSANLMAAKGRLRKAPRKLTNAELMNLKPNQFLKLSPATRARVAALRKARAATANKKPAAKNATARQATRTNLSVYLARPAGPRVPANVLRSNKFNRLVEKIRSTQGGPANETYNNGRYRARQKAINMVQNRMKRGLPPLSPSPPKAPNAPKPKAPNAPKPKAPNAPKPNSNFKLSPSSGRAKIKSNVSGRWVYANLQSLEFLKQLAATRGVNVKGLRSKAEIARKIFG